MQVLDRIERIGGFAANSTHERHIGHGHGGSCHGHGHGHEEEGAAVTPVASETVTETAETAEAAEAAEDMDGVVDTEITNRMQRGAAWGKLELCFRWRAIRTYLEGVGVVESDPRFVQIREMLRCKQLPPPEYDVREARVTRLGVCGL